MVTDESINLAQELLAKQFPRISGLMDTCLGKMHQFGIIPVDTLYTAPSCWLYALGVHIKYGNK